MNIHPTAIVSADARLGDHVIVGPYVVIERDTHIGNCEIRAHAVVKRFTTIGEHCTVYEGVVLGGEPQDVGYKDCVSYLRIGSNNHIREGVTIHRGTQPESVTTVGSGCFIMANAHVGHNCHVGDGVILANNVALAGHVDIGNQAFLSGGVVVHQFCRVGRLAMIGGNSKIVQDCLPFFITDGVPGRARGVNSVGLRRAGINSNEIRKLKEAYQTLLRSGLALESALTRLEGLDDPLVLELIDFVRASTRGFCHEGKAQRARS
ncbi:MAG TPA: acyl-ACP--UDP-N-acetylglucosamine O-acyltransferase [Blastocatellia bacterium]|nr:acyl-ACP--UDP-N-acetylglucosamine O-acyltransferase [Blastocatellia bacterium]